MSVPTSKRDRSEEAARANHRCGQGVLEVVREGAEFRVNGEWFEGSHRLLSHVSQTRRKYGEPMRAWEQVARHAAAKILDTGQIRIV